MLLCKCDDVVADSIGCASNCSATIEGIDDGRYEVTVVAAYGVEKDAFAFEAEVRNNLARIPTDPAPPEPPPRQGPGGGRPAGGGGGGREGKQRKLAYRYENP